MQLKPQSESFGTIFRAAAAGAAIEVFYTADRLNRNTSQIGLEKQKHMACSL